MPRKYTKSSIDIKGLKEFICPQEYYRSQLGSPHRTEKNNLVFFCIFHPDGKNPNLKVGTGGKHKDRFYCFSCQASGDIVDFHQKAHNFTLVEALQDLARIYAPEPISSSKDRGRQ